MNIAGIDHALPLCPVTDDLYIGAFVILGNAPLTEASARELLKRAPEYDLAKNRTLKKSLTNAIVLVQGYSSGTRNGKTTW